MRYIKQLVVALSVLASLLLVNVTPAVATGADIQKGLCTGANLSLNESTGNCSSDATNKLNSLVQRIIKLFSAVVGIVAVVMIIVGGLRYITSGGNDTSVTAAKNTLLYAIIGLIIVALAQLIVHFTLKNISSN